MQQNIDLQLFFCQPWRQIVKHYDIYHFLSVKQNVKDVFIDGHRRKEQQKEIYILKSIEKVKLW